MGRLRRLSFLACSVRKSPAKKVFAHAPSDSAGLSPPGGARADSASAATRAIARRAPAGRRQPALRSRDARSSPWTTSGAQSTPYAACCGSTDHDWEMPDAATQSVSAASRIGTPSIRSETPPSNAASAAGVRGDEGQQDGSRAGVMPARDPAWPMIPSGGGLPAPPPPSPPAAAAAVAPPPTALATAHRRRAHRECTISELLERLWHVDGRFFCVSRGQFELQESLLTFLLYFVVCPSLGTRQTSLYKLR